MIVDFEDSEVSRVSWADGTLTVRFAVMSLAARSGSAPGFVPAVVLTMQSVAAPGALAACMGRLGGGRLVVAGVPVRRVPVPHQASGVVLLELWFRNGEALVCQGQSVTIAVDGPLVHHESFAC